MIIFPIIIILTILMSNQLMADTTQTVVGWHWYNEQPISKKKNNNDNKEILYKEFQQLTSSQQLKILQMATAELKDKAILTGNINDIANYKRAQDMWVSKATMFTVGWERMLLEHPELNYSLQFSHENALAPVMQQNKHLLENEAISNIAKKNGMMLFYRGDNKGDLMFVKVCATFSKEHHIALLLVSENTPSTLFNIPSKFDVNATRANALDIHYFPALLLINPKTGSHRIISYGFMSTDEIAKRFLNINDHWIPNF